MTEETIIIIINYILGALGLLCVLSIIISVPGFIFSIIKESKKAVAPGKKRSYKLTIIFGICFLAGLFILISVLAIWGLLFYILNNLAYIDV